MMSWLLHTRLMRPRRCLHTRRFRIQVTSEDLASVEFSVGMLFGDALSSCCCVRFVQSKKVTTALSWAEAKPGMLWVFGRGSSTHASPRDPQISPVTNSYAAHRIGTAVMHLSLVHTRWSC